MEVFGIYCVKCPVNSHVNISYFDSTQFPCMTDFQWFRIMLQLCLDGISKLVKIFGIFIKQTHRASQLENSKREVLSLTFLRSCYKGMIPYSSCQNCCCFIRTLLQSYLISSNLERLYLFKSTLQVDRLEREREPLNLVSFSSGLCATVLSYHSSSKYLRLSFLQIFK